MAIIQRGSKVRLASRCMRFTKESKETKHVS